jgi:protein-S-isoprenylcysteine O-methyltransferase Ste14
MHSQRRLALVIAWTGAAIFAASLAWFVYCYLFRYGQPAPAGPMAGPLLANVLLFSVFALHHSVLARSGAKRVVHRIAPSELERSLYTWVASALFLAVCTWWQPVPGVLYELTGAPRFFGWAVQLGGLALTVRASHALDILDLAGVRPILRRANAHGAEGQTPPLTTRGLYGFVRHPLYFAWTLFVFGSPTMTGTRASFAIISTAYLMIAIPWEERGLVATFGQEYQAYRRRVRTRMIPWVY